MSELETRSGMGALGVLAGFLGGALLGTVVTMLLAPRSGAETRRRITEQAERSRETLGRVRTAAREATAAARTAFTTALHEESAPGESTPH
jgi:gas vesicle protein